MGSWMYNSHCAVSTPKMIQLGWSTTVQIIEDMPDTRTPYPWGRVNCSRSTRSYAQRFLESRNKWLQCQKTAWCNHSCSYSISFSFKWQLATSVVVACCCMQCTDVQHSRFIDSMLHLVRYALSFLVSAFDPIAHQEWLMIEWLELDSMKKQRLEWQRWSHEWFVPPFFHFIIRFCCMLLDLAPRVEYGRKLEYARSNLDGSTMQKNANEIRTNDRTIIYYYNYRVGTLTAHIAFDPSKSKCLCIGKLKCFVFGMRCIRAEEKTHRGCLLQFYFPIFCCQWTATPVARAIVHAHGTPSECAPSFGVRGTDKWTNVKHVWLL